MDNVQFPFRSESQLAYLGKLWLLTALFFNDR
jgi:hypothetical protein